jgi:hypothetical protein
MDVTVNRQRRTVNCLFQPQIHQIDADPDHVIASEARQSRCSNRRGREGSQRNTNDSGVIPAKAGIQVLCQPLMNDDKR